MAFAMNIRRFMLVRNFSVSSLQQGYIVLVPEIGEDVLDKNPLHANDGLPEFNSLTIEKCRGAIAKQTLDFEAKVKEIEDNLSNAPIVDIFKDVFHPLEEVGMPLLTTWGLSKTLYLANNTLMPTTSYMAIHDRAKRARCTKFNSKTIFEAVKGELVENKTLPSEEARLLKKFSTEGKLNGLDLDENSGQILKYHLSKLAQEQKGYKMKLDFALKLFSQTIQDRTIVKDFPEKLLKSIAVDPNYPLNGPWKFTLYPHIYGPLMEYCGHRETRWNLWQAQVGSGSAYRENDLATGLNLEEIRYAKRHIAQVLGYETYVDMSLETKMANSLNEIQDVLLSLLEFARPAQDAELKSLLDYANERGFKSDKLELWDVPYWRRRQRNVLFEYDEDKIREYFPLNTVLEGLFQLCENLFDIIIKARTGVVSWHKDVKFYDIFEPHSSTPVAGFYVDLYARADEKIQLQNSGFMIGIQSKSQVTDSNPLAALIFNFEKPNSNNQTLLTFKEVKSLFGKFGQALQHLLTRTVYSEVAGLSNIEWDAVGVCEHFLVHWLHNRQIIESISCHCDSGDKLPQQMFSNLCEVDKHMAGLDLSREIYLSMLDLELYSSKDYWLDIIKRLWPQYLNFTLHKIDSHPCSFAEIFSGEWSAAYYSHIWSRMIAADVYSAFYEARGNEQQIKDIGKRFRDTFLALGGSKPTSQIFREFRGRDPSSKALLKSLALKKSATDNISTSN